ncbi:hypothetical protein PCL_09512 [Purpureocillium lilacinum]|uniref:Uncharacterized protein n=1 Tax=Purpureocillium lilacinum TaxID=33203 RepID=A0A2U3DQQ9_PURLI|nr:hypothetical protein PCL_09512 [Purpureocillium lilacinum]
MIPRLRPIDQQLLTTPPVQLEHGKAAKWTTRGGILWAVVFAGIGEISRFVLDTDTQASKQGLLSVFAISFGEKASPVSFGPSYWLPAVSPSSPSFFTEKGPSSSARYTDPAEPIAPLAAERPLSSPPYRQPPANHLKTPLPTAHARQRNEAATFPVGQGQGGRFREKSMQHFWNKRRLRIADNETTPWLKHTGWPEFFEGRPLDIITTSAIQPMAGPNRDRVHLLLGSWQGVPIWSSARAEARLRILMRAVDDIFDRAEATFARTSYRSRCWISSYWRDTFYTRPLRVLPPRTKARYKSAWKEFICYLFRAIALEPRKRREIHNIPLRADEMTMMHHVLSLASRLQDQVEAEGTPNDDEGSESSWCEQSVSELGENTDADGAGVGEGSNDESGGGDISSGVLDEDTSVDGASDDDDETRDDDDSLFCEEDYGSHDEKQSSYRRSISLPHGTRLELAEALFQLSMMFWTHQCQTGVLDSSALVHFTAVMGIHRTSLAYRSAYNYTPSRAALMWVGRLFFLEYALPLCSYDTLVYVWSPRNTYPSQPERLQAIRTKYMLRGCHTPIGEILELKAFGKSIIKREGYRSNLTWSLDGQSLTIGNDKVVHLSEFCTAHRDAIWRVQEQVDEMMLGWKPTEDLSTVVDDLTNKVPGWCLLDSPENGFLGKYKAMTRRAWLSSFRGAALAKAGQWLSCSCLTYLEAGIELATKIFVALHLTAGLPGRGTEITSIRLRNTKLATRDVFVREGQIIIVISYSKSRASNNYAFYTVRYLPKDLASSVLTYLTYIRPFIDFLANRLELPQFRSNEFLFPDPGAKHSRKHLTSTQATTALRLFTNQLRTPWTLSLYRQAAIAIAKRYISELIKKRNFYYPTGASAPVNMIAAGAGHHPYMLLTAYAIDTALPARLQPELLEMYRKLSTIWQDWNSQYHQSRDLSRAVSSAQRATSIRKLSVPITEKRRQESDNDDVSSPKRRKWKGKAEQSDSLSNNDPHPPDGFLFNDEYGIIICVANRWFNQAGNPSIGTSGPSIMSPAATVKAYWRNSPDSRFRHLSSSLSLRNRSQQSWG